MLPDFPRAAAALVRTDFARATLYRWRGSDPSLAPVVMMAHVDVVPVDQPQSWTQAPFGGVVRDGFVWGRGTIDDKGSLWAQLEAVELLLAEGAKPTRTVFFAVGHDEETGGSGAAAVADHLTGELGLRPWLVLDEGGMITHGVVPGATRPVAVVGVGEKGYVSLRLEARSAGGHGSMPPARTAVGRVARAVARLEARPFPMHIRGGAEHFMDWMAPELPFGQRVALSNRWLLSPAIRSIYNKKPSAAAQLRTTTAPTMLAAGTKDNVLARQASAVINFRILPGETVASTVERVTRVINDDAVTVSILDGFQAEPSPTTDPNGAGFAVVQTAYAAVFPQAIVTPFLMVGATDARHYAGRADHVLRTLPLPATAVDLARFHGVNERIGCQDLGQMVRFYRQVLVGVQP